jgi:hypothetical protein
MENLTFMTWAHSQFNSFVNAMVNAEKTVCGKPIAGISASLVEKDIAEINDDFEGGADSLLYGNYVITFNFKARKVGILNTRNGKFAEAYCNKNDEFLPAVGLGVCWAKYNHVERPKFEVKKRLSELKPHDIFHWGCNRYEFIGTADNRRKDGKKYIILRLSDDSICQFYEDTVIVEE